MKKFLLLICLVITVSITVAQNGRNLEALKIAYITKRLDLSPEEAQKFWPIYNQYAEELKRSRQDALRNNKSEIELDEELLNVRKKYNALFNQAISPQKIDIFFKSEKEFGHFVQEEIKRRRQMKNQRNLDQNPN
jgi:Skp family chaperone for outer membrane proteins